MNLWSGEEEGGAGWRYVDDGVMGGLSRGRITHCPTADRGCVCLEGEVRVENNGGFIQINRDLPPADRNLSAWEGLTLTVRGNGSTYGLHLKTGDVTAPWQSYRAEFSAPATWATVSLPFALFEPHRIASPFDLTDVRRIAVVAIGRAFAARVCVAGVRLYGR